MKTEVLANLKTESDKNLRLPISEEIQALIKYFGTFLSVILVILVILLFFSP